jgi:biotin transport system substrate-specific component
MEFVKRRSTYIAISRKIILTFLFALTTGYAAQLRIPLPWTPVPITLQTFVVLLAGISLGAMWGGASQLLYVLCGAFGVPFFSGMEGGLCVLWGPRGGYLLGFILTAFVVGRICEKWQNALFLKTLLAYVVLIYGLGCAHLSLCICLSAGAWPALWAVLQMGMFPFIIGDFIKIVGAVWVGNIIRRVF